MASRRARPFIASYRLQLTPEFGFEQARSLLDSIARLGISHLYLSPIAEAVPGSQHGYDVVDPRAVRAEFGGEAGLERLLDAAAERDLGVIIDHVPNHVSVSRAELNPWWWEVLRDGSTAPAADWFDIEWEAAGGRVILPKLGDPLDQVVAEGGIELVSGDVGPELRYGPLRFPIAAGTEGLPLPELLEAQHYALTWWRDPARNVRRFFTIDDLVAVRVENDGVRTVIDSLPERLTAHPTFDGVRVDHVDGLAEPGRYLEQLRSTIGDRWLLVEKILGPGETLPAGWPVDGTTGYEHITTTEHLMLDGAALPIFDAFWAGIVSSAQEVPAAPAFATIEDTARREVLDAGLRPDLDRLVRTVALEASEIESAAIDHDDVRTAIVELTVRLHRYRTYLPDDRSSLEVLEELAERTTAACPHLADTIAWFVALLSRSDAVLTRWQQLTGPAMAKGAEDRAFYRHQRLSSLCEVGGDPGSWSLGLDEFHRRQLEVQQGWPTTMLTSTTHDTKRSAGVRSRSLALATMPESFVAEAGAWIADDRALDASLRPSDVSLAIQTALTAWPVDAERLTSYLVKSAREAEQDTSWINANTAYEAALAGLADRLVDGMNDPSSQLTALGRRLVGPGAAIGLRLKVLQLTCPGVPDLYQGAPLELLSLVDPDNRRSPDWERWRDALTDAPRVVIDDALADGDVDGSRAATVQRLLAMRRRRPGAFGPNAGYRRVEVEGPARDAVVAFERFGPGTTANDQDVVLVLVLRPTVAGLDLTSTTIGLEGNQWVDALAVSPAVVPTGSVSVAALLGDSGVAVCELER